MTQHEPTTQRLTPAGRGAGEGEWSAPDLEHREGWLSEARQQFHFHKDRRAADAWPKAMQAQRVIRLIKAVDERDAEIASLRAQVADHDQILAERDEARRAAAILLEAKLQAEQALRNRERTLAEIKSAVTVLQGALA